MVIINKNSNKGIKIPFKKMLYFFIIFSFIGCIYEDLFIMFRKYINTGELVYVTKRGLLYFELSPIYGLGACIMIYILTRKPREKHDYFWLGAIIGGVFEYLISFLQEMFTGTVSWDYSDFFLNINGRTNIPYMLFWGLMCYLLMTKLYPFINKQIDKFPKKIDKIIYPVVIILISLDMFISFSACIRLGLRHEGHPPLTFYGEFLDKYYDDDRMKESYTNMVDTK